MSNTITHLAVAKEILKKCPALVKNEMVFYLGCIAPDTVTGKEGATRDDKKNSFAD